MRLTASYSIFYATIALVIVNFINRLIKSPKEKSFSANIKDWYKETIIGLEKGAFNMIAVGVAIATAGVIVGAVGSTGLSTNLILVIESIAGDLSLIHI